MPDTSHQYSLGGGKLPQRCQCARQSVQYSSITVRHSSSSGRKFSHCVSTVMFWQKLREHSSNPGHRVEPHAMHGMYGAFRVHPHCLRRASTRFLNSCGMSEKLTVIGGTTCATRRDASSASVGTPCRDVASSAISIIVLYGRLPTCSEMHWLVMRTQKQTATMKNACAACSGACLTQRTQSYNSCSATHSLSRHFDSCSTTRGQSRGPPVALTVPVPTRVPAPLVGDAFVPSAFRNLCTETARHVLRPSAPCAP